MSKNLKANIISSVKQGTFLTFIEDEYFQNRKEADFFNTLIELHNKREIDVILEFNKLDNKGFSFFSIRSILEKILPKINAPVLEVKEAVKTLTLRAGNDMESHSLIKPFIEFCSADEKRVEKLLETALDAIDDFDHISTALIAGFNINQNVYFNKTIGLINHPSDKVKCRAIWALSRFDFSKNKKLAKKCIKKILECSKDNQSEEILTEILGTIATLTSTLELEDTSLITFLELHKSIRGGIFLHKIAYLLKLYELSNNAQKKMFSFFAKLNPKNVGTLEYIDWYLYGKVGEPIFTEQVEFLLNNITSVNWLARFKNTKHKIQKEEYRTFLSQLITKWFLTRNGMYCLTCRELLTIGTTEQLTITFDESQIKDADIIYLAKKSIGWLHHIPITATELILSIIPLCNKQHIAQIEEITLRFLYINCPSQVGDCLKKQLNLPNGKIRLFATTLIKRYEQYLKTLERLFKIDEMQPSERQRSFYRNYQQKQMVEAFDKKSDGSFVSAFFPKRVTILYGNQVIYHQRIGEGKKRIVTPLQSHQVSVEVPRLPIFEPHIFQYELEEFQYGGCEK